VRFPLQLILDELDPDPTRSLPAARQMGFSACAIRMVGSNRFPYISEDDYRWLQEQSKSGLIASVSPGLNKDVFVAEQARHLAQVDFPMCVQRARGLGARDISLFSWAKPDEALPPIHSEGLSPSAPGEDMADALRVMARIAGAAGMTLSLEIGYQCWGDSGRAVRELIEAAGEESLRIIWDPCNSLAGRSWWTQRHPEVTLPADVAEYLLEELDLIFPLISNVHVRDMTLDRDGWSYVFAGQGLVPWPLLLRALRKKGYQGPLTVEHHLAPLDKEKATLHTARFLEELMKEPNNGSTA
jgi:sugar phosphate isomerase/epimerase